MKIHDIAPDSGFCDDKILFPQVVSEPPVPIADDGCDRDEVDRGVECWSLCLSLR